MHQQEKFKRPEESLIVVISKGLSLHEASSLKLVECAVPSNVQTPTQSDKAHEKTRKHDPIKGTK